MSRPDAQSLLIVLALLAVLLHVTFPVAVVITAPFTISGIIVIAAGLVLVLWGRSYLVHHATTLSPFATPSVFLTDGPFQFSRNPIYLGMALVLFGIAILLGSLVTFVMPVLFIMVVTITVIPAEERVLEDEFGEGYRRYRQFVRRWI
jgi:protein-S-isoprenylcysteine O-methyltransferase Ste14